MNWPIFLALPLLLLFVALFIILAALERWRREKHRLELQKAILERVGSVKDFAEFLATEPGERFLGSLAPAQFRPHHRSLGAVRLGIVLLTVGVFLMVALHARFLGSDETTPRPLLLGILLLIGSGLGLLLSAGASFLIGRRLGLMNGQSGGRKKGDAV
jgi:hypothetical protein